MNSIYPTDHNLVNIDIDELLNLNKLPERHGYEETPANLFKDILYQGRKT